MNERLQEKILMNITDNDPQQCWLWKGQISNSGYGRIKYRDDTGEVRMQSAGYVSYLAFVGPVPAGMSPRAVCNNRLCVNPAHLELVELDAAVRQAGL